MERYDVVVIGAGHNGLACACYLARAGLSVVVLEMADRVGGAVHTAETVPDRPGYRFDTCSVVHNLVNMTSIPEELELGKAGLEYVETDPFTTALLPNGDFVRFYRSVERTCEEIRRFSPDDATAYARFVRWATPIMELSVSRLRQGADDRSAVRSAGKRIGTAGRALLRGGPRRLSSDLLGPYGPLLEGWFRTEHARMGVVPLAAHGTLGPRTPGTAFFACFQAAYHRYGNWHARGGSGALARAMVHRLEAWGGRVRTGARVTRILARGGAEGVELESGERVETRRVVAAINPQTALLELLGADALPARLERRLRSRHRSNAVQFVVHATLDRLPPWPDAPPEVWNGLQSVAGSLEQVKRNFLEAEAGIAPSDPAVYLYTSSAIDERMAPPGKHVAYIACASYPARFADGASWWERGEGEANRLLDVVESRAPGFRSGVTGLAWRHAAWWEREIGLLDGHPMHLDITMDQAGPFRPLPELSDHRGPVERLYLSGAGTAPGGGVSAVPGRDAARSVLEDW